MNFLLSRILVFAMCSLACASFSARAATYNWANSGTDWNTAANWGGAGFPGTLASDVANFNVATTVNPFVSGTVTFSRMTAQGSAGTIGISGTTITLTSTGTLTGAAINYSSTTALTINAPIVFGAATGTQTINVNSASGTVAINNGITATGAAALQKQGLGTLVLSTANTYTGGTILNGGTTSVVNGALGASGTIAFTGGALQYASGNTQDISSRIGNSTGAMIIDTGANNVTFGSALASSNVGGLTKLGTGTLALNATNNYSGTTTLSAGTLALGAVNAIGSGTLVFAGGALTATTNLTGTNKVTNNIVLSNNVSLGADSASVEFSGNINQSGVLRQITVNSGTGVTTFSGVISNDGGAGFRIISTGTTVLSGLNTFTGAMELRGASPVIVTQINNAGIAGNLGAGSIIRLGSNSSTAANLRYAGTGETTDRTVDLGTSTGAISIEQAGTGLLKFTSNFTASGSGSKTLTLKGSTSGTGEIAGGIVNNSGTNITSVTKSGTGTWVLSGSSSYTGATTVSAGTLLVNGSITSPVTTASGATIGGSGTISGSVAINFGGTLSAGITTTGILNTGDITLAGSLAQQMDTASGTPVAGVNYDQVNVTGSVTLTGGDLTISLLTGVSQGDIFYIINNDGSDLVTGIFATLNGVAADLSQNAYFTTGGQTYQISYVANNGSGMSGGNDVALMVVPEPEALALFGLGMTALWWRARSRDVVN